MGSGCSALIYEIVWYQLLQLVIGSTAVSLGVLLATFMGGLCLGSLAVPRLISARVSILCGFTRWIGVGHRSVRVLAVLFGMPLVDHLYAAAAGHGLSGHAAARGACARVCLLPPTLLMGASLPAIARWIETTPEGVSWLGLLYGGNTAGAVFGCLLAGFYLLRVFDMATATLCRGRDQLQRWRWLACSRRPEHVPKSRLRDARKSRGARANAWAVYVTIALSGVCALGAEVIWTRLLGLLFGATVYTFSIILAVFLVGLGIGSGAGSLWSTRLEQPARRVGLLPDAAGRGDRLDRVSRWPIRCPIGR